MEAPVALFTVATDSVANVSAETPAGIRVHVHKPNWPRPVDLVVRAAESPAALAPSTSSRMNTDPGAPILAHADYAVVGDLHQVIPARSSPPREGQGMQGLDPHCRICILSTPRVVGRPCSGASYSDPLPR